MAKKECYAQSEQMTRNGKRILRGMERIGHILLFWAFPTINRQLSRGQCPGRIQAQSLGDIDAHTHLSSRLDWAVFAWVGRGHWSMREAKSISSMTFLAQEEDEQTFHEQKQLTEKDGIEERGQKATSIISWKHYRVVALWPTRGGRCAKEKKNSRYGDPF